MFCQQGTITGLYITFVFGMVHIALNKAYFFHFKNYRETTNHSLSPFYAIKPTRNICQGMDNLFYSDGEEYDMKEWRFPLFKKILQWLFIQTLTFKKGKPQDQDENIKNGNSLCFDAEFVESICSMQKIRIIKTVRFVAKYVGNQYLHLLLHFKVESLSSWKTDEKS